MDGGTARAGPLTAGGTPRSPLRQPRLAELIAGVLRERIMRGEYRDGTYLPKQEELLEEFSVSKPSVREALRVLETEGLIRVRRGNQGGAVVHQPQSHDAAYMMGLVLQSRRVGLADVGTALLCLEPACAALCAERTDRDQVAEQLQGLQDRSVAAIDDDIEFVENMRRFHEVLVEACGNETMKVVVGALEALWSVREQAWARSASASGDYPGREMRERGLRAHERIIALIAGGDSDAVFRACDGHLRAAQLYARPDDPTDLVDAIVLRTSGSSSTS